MKHAVRVGPGDAREEVRAVFTALKRLLPVFGRRSTEASAVRRGDTCKYHSCTCHTFMREGGGCHFGWTICPLSRSLIGVCCTASHRTVGGLSQIYRFQQQVFRDHLSFEFLRRTGTTYFSLRLTHHHYK